MVLNMEQIKDILNKYINEIDLSSIIANGIVLILFGIIIIIFGYLIKKRIRDSYIFSRDTLNNYKKIRKKNKDNLTLNQKTNLYIVDGKGVRLFNKIGFYMILIGITLSFIVPIIIPIITYLLS